MAHVCPWWSAWFTIPMARMVGDQGRVIAVETAETFPDSLLPGRRS